ncbi:MAG: site-specific integrase [Marinilabiliales bacterium]|nr:site-specific integrase [Marinilabiliales bacterium]
MAKASFFLKEPNSESETVIYLFFNFNNKRLKYSTGEKIHPEYWNANKQRTKETKKFPSYPELNARLERISSRALDIYRRMKNDDLLITDQLLKKEFDKEFRKEETPRATKDLFSFIEKFIEESYGLKNVSTIRTYINTLRHLKNYADLKKRKLNFEDVNLEFYNSLIHYLTNEIGLSQNSIGGHVKNLKTFLNEATERGLNNNMDFKKRKFRQLSEENEKVYLNTSELDKIYRLDLSKIQKYERIRDLFIVGCYTGLRFSDFIQIKKENIIDSNKLKIRTQKTGETVIIPLHPYIREIITKYDGQIPEPISNQKMNDYLKEIAKLADLNDLVEISITKGGKVLKSTIEKYHLIMTHTARRSFATNLFLVGIPSITIMKITGHKTEKNFLKYIRISQEENANKLLNHPFFN